MNRSVLFAVSTSFVHRGAMTKVATVEFDPHGGISACRCMKVQQQPFFAPPTPTGTYTHMYGSLEWLVGGGAAGVR